MAKSTKSGLGRGLNSLLGAYEEPVAAEPAPKPAPKPRVTVESDDLPKVEVSPVQPVESRQEVAMPQAPHVEDNLLVEENVQIKGIVERKLDEVPIEYVSPNPDQPRTNFKQEEIEELAASIEKDGVLQPILVRMVEKNSYQIIAGERRWQACKFIGMKTVPIRIKEADDDKALELALIETCSALI